MGFVGYVKSEVDWMEIVVGCFNFWFIVILWDSGVGVVRIFDF